jgi:hypothetical protein
MGGMLVTIVRKGYGDLEKDEDGEQHAHEAVGFAKGGHVFQRLLGRNGIMGWRKRDAAKGEEWNRN